MGIERMFLGHKTFDDKGPALEYYIEKLKKDKSLRQYFFDAAGNPTSDPNLEGKLRNLLEGNYQKFGEEYFKKGWFQKYIIGLPLELVRLGGIGANLLGDYLFHFSAGAAAGPGYLLKTAGLAATLLPDAVEAIRFLVRNPSAHSLESVIKLLGETAASKAAMYTPYFGGSLLEYRLGKDRFQRAASDSILYKTRSEFLKQIGSYTQPTQEELDKQRIIPIAAARAMFVPRYAKAA